MLFFKVVLALSVYQHYCVGITRFHHGIVSEFPPKLPQEETLLADDDVTTKPDKIPTTDSESTKKPDENPTTTTPTPTTTTTTTTTESGECPKDKSLYSKEDIRDIIDFVFIELGLNESMVEHVVPQAKDINQKLSEDLNQFENWFQNQPEHLIHVLQGLSAVRNKTIEPEAKKIAVILKDYPQLKANIDEKQLSFIKLSKKLNKYENLCKYTCEDQESEPSHIFKRSIKEEYVCSSIADLHKQIKTELTENFDGFLNNIKNNLLVLNKTYTEKIENIKIYLKDSALKEFGRTMYNVLKLEDEYHHFVKEINSTDTQILMYTVKEAGLQMDSKLLELQRLIEDYGNYCRNCNKGPAKRFVRQAKLLTNVNENSNSSIVHELIQDKYNESEHEVTKIFEDTFKDLDAIINDPNRTESYLNILKLKQKEIVEAENIEQQGLDLLRNIASPESLKKLSDLDTFSKDQLKYIDEKIAHVKKITP